MLPKVEDFPEQQDLAALLPALTRESTTDDEPPLSDCQQLAKFLQLAAQENLTLPFEWAAVLSWEEELDALIESYAALIACPETSRGLLLWIREITRRERFVKFCNTHNQGLVGLYWGLAERACGSKAKSEQVWRWALNQVEEFRDPEWEGVATLKGILEAVSAENPDRKLFSSIAFSFDSISSSSHSWRSQPDWL